LRRSALILLVAGLVLTALVVFGGLQPLGAIVAFVCITGAALVPWQVQDPDASRETELWANPVETEVAHAIVAGMPDPNVLLDCAGASSRSSHCERLRSSRRCVRRLRPGNRGGRPISILFRSIGGWN
jgi:hypothetical protein